ncbi:uncharacterized protein LOC116015557 isoform X2 [Ipomoea triloba]|uniref:uncharacterized protein LOC116015557 isoform X2 n=1 Tax=Ipomoea triloba TaxID=35885 RepID=UPI00125DEE8C|nr:uncharacterized protein LOC116015557 isoform X2 [Ipomoea triloba]
MDLCSTESLYMCHLLRGKRKGKHSYSYSSYAHMQPTQSVALGKESVNQQRLLLWPFQMDLVLKDQKIKLSSLLVGASPEQQKQILGERLYPLVSECKSIEAVGLRDHLSALAESLSKARIMIYPPMPKTAKLGEVLSGHFEAHGRLILQSNY